MRVGNDVDVATNAEFKLGAGKPYRSLLGVFWGTGVGGGLILDGKRWLGRGAAGEIGHMVVGRGGAPLPLRAARLHGGLRGPRARWRRRRGASTTTATKTDLFKIMKKRGRDRLTSSIWDAGARARRRAGEKLIDRAVKALGAGVASAVNLLDVEAVIIGGGLGVRLGEPYVEQIRKRDAQAPVRRRQPPAIHLAALGDFGGAIGASLLFDEYATATDARRGSRKSAA